MPDNGHKKKREFSGQIHVHERRKIRGRKQKPDEIWFGLGMFGMVGWAVALPTVMGIFFGMWIDVTWSGPYSWTLMLLVIGLILGCVNAWYWVNKQRREINEFRDKDDQD